LDRKGSLKDGERHGPWEWYHENGQLGGKGSYKDGEMDGPWEEYYYENGQLGWKGSHSNGEQCGEWFDNGETVTYDPCPPDLEGAV
jgi:antitoxin component YwqK of YwqJK toxin-antitoxin module